MAKKKGEKPQRILTHRQRSRREQQKRRQRIILVSGIFIIAAVLSIVLVGWFLGQYQPMHQTAIRVNETEFNMKYYVEVLKLYRGEQDNSYLSYLADEAIKNIEQNELIKQAALKLGFSVSKDTVKEEIKTAELPDNDASRDLVGNQLLLKKLLDEYFDQQAPWSAEQVHLMAMLLESESQANEVRARLENGESFIRLAEELSLDYLAQSNQGDFGWHPRDILNEMLSEPLVDYAFSAEADVLSQPKYDEETSKGVGYWLVKVLDRNEDEKEAHVQVILLGNEVEAQQIRSRLEAGEDFATLAKEFSQLKGVEENEGEYELSPGMMSPVFDDFAFNPELKLETISEPLRDETIATDGGYWLIRVVAKDDDRQIEKDDRDFLKAKTLNEWVSSLWDNPENEVDDSYLDTEKKAWAIEQATRG